ncbi:hypothetical protein BUALT_Bualt15G0000200 [Buddleja alternifolia]|uniref:Uncharacterized protein n=1 Tax=Buddleja alternifolia TaxID=168488 RepID=A0AAV6WD56_9LAMI|nr:hypothetical protein BUALT_Bualt15G0000200 [Buddleja alternifolia]
MRNSGGKLICRDRESRSDGRGIRSVDGAAIYCDSERDDAGSGNISSSGFGFGGEETISGGGGDEDGDSKVASEGWGWWNWWFDGGKSSVRSVMKASIYSEEEEKRREKRDLPSEMVTSGLRHYRSRPSGSGDRENGGCGFFSWLDPPMCTFVFVAPPPAFDLAALCKDLKVTHCFPCLMKSALSDTPPKFATFWFSSVTVAAVCALGTT